MHHTHHGYTVIETMIALAIVATLAAIAYPSFQQQVLQSRRSDSVTALLRIQLQQERWRSDNPQYASLQQLGLSDTSARGHYRLTVTDETHRRYAATARAHGGQARDATCRVMRIAVENAHTVFASGSDESASNPASINQRCWQQ